MKAPEFLKGYGLSKWEELTTKNRKGMNYDLLAAYCAHFSRWMDAEIWLVSGGDVDRTVITIWDEKGNIKSHGPSPQMRISKEAVREMQRLAIELGI